MELAWPKGHCQIIAFLGLHDCICLLTVPNCPIEVVSLKCTRSPEYICKTCTGTVVHAWTHAHALHKHTPLCSPEASLSSNVTSPTVTNRVTPRAWLGHSLQNLILCCILKHQGTCDSNVENTCSTVGTALPFFGAPLQIPEVLH